VSQSLARSLDNLNTSYIDSLVLHSPLRSRADTLAVWRQFETAVDGGVVRQLGISNLYDPDTFRWLHENARHKPKVLQNRFYRDSGYDKVSRHPHTTHPRFTMSTT
jgi:diketogulonate reductase-like aldo/keto reductase